MRTASLAVLSIVTGLAACAAPGAPEVGRAAQCAAVFQRYDRALLSQRDLPFVGPGAPVARATSPTVGPETELRQNDCISFGSDVALEADLSAFAASPAVVAGSGRYVHVGIVTSNALADQVSARLSALGYPVVVKGADRLGRRIFLGPLASGDAVLAAEGAAEALGFPGVYALDRLP